MALTVTSSAQPPPPPPFSLSLANSGPPQFVTDLAPQTVAPGTNLSYTLPDISDPDGDDWIIECNLGTAIAFASFSVNTFHISPHSSDSGTYKIQIKLTDKNEYPKTQKYNLAVNVPQI